MGGGPTPYEAEKQKVRDLSHRLVLIIEAANSSDAVLFNMVKQVQNDADYPLELLKVLAGDRD